MMKCINHWTKNIVLFGLTLGLLLSCSQVKNEVFLTGPTMGTTYNIKYVPNDAVTTEDLKQQIDAELELVNQLMSTYIQDSELSLFNQWQSDEPFAMSAQTITVMQEAKRLGDISDGFLDVTVGPLVNLWGFGPENRTEKVPTEERIEQIRQTIGLSNLTLDGNSASKLIPALYVDLSTIAKGHGVDQLASILEQHNIVNYLVEVGGEMRISGVKTSGEPWRVAIEKPAKDKRAVQKIISVGNNAVATSGDYRNYYESEGVRYSHLINPNTGYPIKHNLVSVTVVHPSSMTADGLATAFNVMGKERALVLAEQEQVAVLLITKEKDGFREYTSQQFEKVVTVY